MNFTGFSFGWWSIRRRWSEVVPLQNWTGYSSPSLDGGAMEPTIQRWSAKRKVELLLQLIRGEKKLVDVCREQDLKQSEVEAWMDTFVKAGERGLKANAEEELATHAKELKELRAKVGELVLELDARKKWAALNGRDETAF
jgi:transposase-like protein